ncbi:TPA: ketose-bisphosphate aldolase [Streptococcus suis]
MLTHSKPLFAQAKLEKFAIPATNFIDSSSARTYCRVAEERGLPLILAFAQSHRHFLTLDEAAAIGKVVAEEVSVPIVLHLDHGEDLEYVERAIELGFTSVMIDASRKSFEDNVALTKQVVELAHAKGIVVEAELGHVGSNDLSESSKLTNSVYTEVDKVLDFIEATQVDSLAISIGTAHGIYKGEPKINFERLGEIAELTSTPLVLHGGSSSGDENLGRCAREGISKINIYSDFLVGAQQEIIAQGAQDYVSIKEAADQGMAKVLHRYYDVFGTKAVEV